MDFMTIGKLARESGIGVETIRYYQRMKLLPTPSKKDGFRTYSPEFLKRIHFIKKAKDLGFTLKEIQFFFDLKVKPGSHCEDVKARAIQKVADIQSKIRSLEEIKCSLLRLIQSCENSGADTLSDCPILDALDQE